MPDGVVEKPNTQAQPNGTPVVPPIVDDTERKKREAEIKKRGAELKAEKDTINKKRAELLAEQKQLDEERKEMAEFKKWRSTATVDPDAFLGPIYGKDWRDALAKYTAGDGTPLAVRQLREQLEAEKKARETDDAKKANAAKDAASKAEEAAKKEAADKEEAEFKAYQQDIATKWIKENEAKYPTLAASGLAHEIANKARVIFLQTGEMPDEHVIAAEFEATLDKLFDTVYATPKWSEKLAAKFKAPSPVRKVDPPMFQVKQRSISQEMAPGTKAPPMTREQKREALLRDWDNKVPKAG